VAAVPKKLFANNEFFLVFCEDHIINISLRNLDPLLWCSVIYIHPVYSSLNARHYLSYPHKTAAKLWFCLSQYLRPWISKCRHHTYKLMIGRHARKFFCS